MKNLSVIAQDTMDAYYQQPFVDDNETPFDLDYFKRLCADAYTSLLDKEFTALLGTQRGDGVGRTQNITLDNSWLHWESAVPKKDEKRGDFFITLKYAILSFSYDQSDMGLQNVSPLRSGCEVVRDRQATGWMDKLVEGMGVIFFRPSGNTVRFTGNCGEVYVGYVPAVPANCDLEVRDNKALDIRKEALNLMLVAKQGTPVSNATNDSSTNVMPQSETNKETVSQ